MTSDIFTREDGDVAQVTNGVAGALLISLLASAAAAQSMAPDPVFGRYQQFYWQQQHGLPQNSVIALTTTRDGYLWLGTYEGAVRFDGTRFALFNPGNTPEIGNQHVQALLEDAAGNLWIGTFGGGLTRFTSGRFTRYTTRDGLSSDYVLSLFEDRNGTLWIGTNGGGLNRWRDGRFTHYTTDDGLPVNEVGAITADGSDGLWVGTANGLARFSQGRVTTFVDHPDLLRAHILALARTRDGAIWVGSSAAGLFRIDDRQVRKFGPGDGLTSVRMERLHVDENDRVWVGTADQGLFRFSNGRFERYSTREGLAGNRVPAIGPGFGDDLWLGTDGGLARLTPPRFKVYTSRDGLAEDLARSIYQDPDGNVWVGSSKGLSRFKDGRFVVYTTKDGLPHNTIVTIAEGAGRTTWVLTRAGLTRFDGDRFFRWREIGGVAPESVTAILQDSSGGLWLGTREAGVARLRDGQVTRYTRREGLPDDTVLTLFEDRAGNVWIGTLRGGIARVNGNGRLKSWSTREGLASNHVKTFYQDRAGTLWIGGGGLSRFRDETVTALSSRQGLFNDTVFQILEDEEGNLWMNGNAGISRASVKDLNDVADGRAPALTSYAYGVTDGMLSSEGVGMSPAGWKMHDGSLWFPTTRGVVVVDPRARSAQEPRVVIESVAVDGRIVPADHAVRLSPGQENLEIQYTGLSWNRPQAIRFKFRLVGLDSHWVEAGARRTAYYSHVPPGSYTFTVTADNGEGVWNTQGASLPLVVVPPFWQTWWFVALSLVAVAALAALLHTRRVRSLDRARAAQAAFSQQVIASQETERKRIAAELHDSLGQNLLIIKNRAALGSQTKPDPETAREQFEEIAASATQSIEEVRQIAYNLRPYHLDRLGLANSIEDMVERIGSSSDIRFETAIAQLDGAIPKDLEITLYRIVQEGVNNIVRHAQATRAWIEVSRDAHHVTIAIRDDGKGFHGGGAGLSVPSQGFGLTGIAERVRMLDGTHVVTSSPGHGTTIEIRLPLQG